MYFSLANNQPLGEVMPLLRSCEQLGGAAQMADLCVGVCPYFRRRGRKYGHGEPCTWKSLLMNQSTYGYGRRKPMDKYWKLIWIMIMLGAFRQV